MAVRIACNLDPAGFQERQQHLGRLLAQAAERRDLHEGYAFIFPADSMTLTEVAKVIEPERRCCPFIMEKLPKS